MAARAGNSGVRAAAVSRSVCRAVLPQGATAAPAVGARPARRGDLLGRRRSAGDGVGHRLAGDPVTQADEHRAARLLVDPHHVEELADEQRRVGAYARLRLSTGPRRRDGRSSAARRPRRRNSCRIITSWSVVESLEHPGLSDAGRGRISVSAPRDLARSATDTSSTDAIAATTTPGAEASAAARPEPFDDLAGEDGRDVVDADRVEPVEEDP